MKFIKTNVLLVFMFMLVWAYSAHAEELSEGYIVKLSGDVITLFSAEDDGITHLGDDYYRADSIEAIYETFSHEAIERIIPDCQLELFDAEYPKVTSDEKISEQWNLDMICAEVAREKGISGRGVKVAVIDSGLNVNHADLKNANILQGYNCILNTNDVYDISDKVGHGTVVSGIIAAQTDNQTDIAGIADEAYIIPLKITDKSTFNLSDLYPGIKKAIELDCDIINLSLGGLCQKEIERQEFKSWIDMANDAGIIVIAAVGNDGNGTFYYPAAFDNVIGVGSVNKYRRYSTLSQYNESVFVVAPGEKVCTLIAGKSTGATSSYSGTSFATPHVTAAVALIKELKPDASLNEIMEILKNTSVDSGEVGYDIYYGHGLLNIKNILKSLDEYVPDVVISQGMKDGTDRIYIHNNTGEVITANGYFVKYQENRLLNLSVLQDIKVKVGVTSYPYGDEYDCFLLWDSNLVPYTTKYFNQR